LLIVVNHGTQFIVSIFYKNTVLMNLLFLYKEL